MVLAKTRRQLRRAVRVTNQILNSLKLEKHPDKTFIGLIERGFEFLRLHFSRSGLQIAQQTLDNFIAKQPGPYLLNDGSKARRHRKVPNGWGAM